MFGILFKYFQNIKDTNNDTSPLRDGNSKTANKKKETYSVIFLSYIQGGGKNPNHLFMSTKSDHIVVVLVVTKEEVKQQTIKSGKVLNNLYPAV